MPAMPATHQPRFCVTNPPSSRPPSTSLGSSLRNASNFLPCHSPLLYSLPLSSANTASVSSRRKIHNRVAAFSPLLGTVGHHTMHAEPQRPVQQVAQRITDVDDRAAGEGPRWRPTAPQLGGGPAGRPGGRRVAPGSRRSYGRRGRWGRRWVPRKVSVRRTRALVESLSGRWYRVW